MLLPSAKLELGNDAAEIVCIEIRHASAAYTQVANTCIEV